METKVYLIVFSEAKLSRQQLKEFLNKNGSVIKHWFYNLNGTMFIKTTFQTAKELSTFIEAEFGEFRHFTIQVTDGKYYGRLPVDHWALIKQKKNK